MIVGHRVAVSRDEETRALAHGILTPLRPRSLPVAIGPAKARRGVRLTEATEEILERRAAQGIVFIEHQALARIDLDLHRDHRGLYLFNDVSEAYRPLCALCVRIGRRE